MARIYFFVAFVALAAVASSAPQIVENLDVEIIQEDNKFRTENPGVKLRALDAQPKGQIRYTLGNRISGDRLVAQASNNYVYPTYQDVQLKLNYPTSGYGAIITYVEVVVDQSSNDGNAYVTSGGIGQRQISLLVEAKWTSFFNYRVVFYGY